MAKKSGSFVDPSAPEGMSSFADALRRGGLNVSRSSSVPATAPLPAAQRGAPAGLDLSRSAKIVLRRERKGHGGKTVTVIDGLGLPAAALESVAREMRKALGCGSSVDAGRVLLQGDMIERAETWLRTRGAARIVRGN